VIAVPQHGFVFLAMTKCASTAIEDELQEDGLVITRNHPGLKHMNYGGFSRSLLPLLRRAGFKPNTYDVVCVFREPISWMHSWYRYRSRKALVKAGRARNYVGDMSFDDFCNAYIEGRERFATSIGQQSRFVRSPEHKVAVDRIFRYEEMPRFVAYMTDRLGRRISLEQLNVSPTTDLELAPSTRARLREHLADDYDIYERLANGHKIEERTPRDDRPGAGGQDAAQHNGVAGDEAKAAAGS
jgi:hypothetical protein